MDSNTSGKILSFIMDFLTRYIIWIIVAIIVVIWWFFPDLMQSIEQFVLFWGPAIALIFTLILALARTKIKSKKDEGSGITQYDITITKWELYIINLLIYGGALLILIIPAVINEGGGDITDLIQALIYFAFATWTKQIFTNKILK